MGEDYLAQGRYDEALAAFELALQIARERGDRAGEGATFYHIGSVCHVQGRYAEALEMFQQALTVHRKIDHRAGEGATLYCIGFVYHTQGRYAEALTSLEQALTIMQEVGDRAGAGKTLSGIGAIYQSQGRYRESLASLEQALAIMQEVGDRAGTGTALNGIGNSYYSQGRYREALTIFGQALAIMQEVGDRAGAGTALSGIGAVYQSQGRYRESLASFEQALAIAQEVGDQVGAERTLSGIGAVYAGQGRYEEALASFEQALAIAQEVGDRAGVGATLNNFGIVYQDQGRYGEALTNYAEAIKVVDETRATAGSDEARTTFIAQYADTYDRTIALYYQFNRPEDAFHMAERGRARTFLDGLATGQIQLEDNAAVDLLAQEQELYARRQAMQDTLAQARAQEPGDEAWLADLETELAEIEAAYAGMQAEIRARGDQLADLAPGRSQNALGVSQVQALLDAQTTLLSYYILEEQTLAFIIGQAHFVVVELDVSREKLINLIYGFRAAIEMRKFDAARQWGQNLYRALIEPISDALTTPRLIVAPHQVLHYLPFATLSNPDTRRYLLEDYSLTTIPSASALPFIQKNARQTAGLARPPLILGNPTGDLPAAEQEAQTIAGQFGVAPLLGQAAAKSVVYDQAAGAGILHLAAHGSFDPFQPLASKIMLTPGDGPDGDLKADEVFGLNLHQTDLVVLSACQTQLGRLSAGDELVGLTRAFFYAGTPTVIATLWNVNDAATSFLMERFYTHLKAGRRKAEALRQAQLETRVEYPEPYYWAAFVLSGDGG